LTSASASGLTRSNPTKWSWDCSASPRQRQNRPRARFHQGGPSADAAKAAGAEFVGFEDMIKNARKAGLISTSLWRTPEAMGEVRKLAKSSDRVASCPNPKTGTVTDDTGRAVKEVKAGRVEFKIDKAGNIHVPVGKNSFAANAIEEKPRVIDAVHKGEAAQCKRHIHP